MSREIDAKVHVHVLGKPETCRLIGEGTPEDPRRLDFPDAAWRERSIRDDFWERWSPDGAERIVWAPPYTADTPEGWAAMRSVVEAMRGKGFSLDLSVDALGWSASFEKVVELVPRGKQTTLVGEVEADSAPEAVALAALRALGVDRG